MLFERPKDLKVVDMCQEVDKLIQQNEWTEDEKNTIVLYLYHIIYAISTRYKYFYNEEDCSDFSIYLAEQLYYRFTDREKGLDRINSCLNYLKKVLYGRVLSWQQKDRFHEVLEDYNCSEDYTNGNFIDTTLYKEQIKNEIESSDRNELVKYIKGEIEELPNTIKKVCSLTQFKNDKALTNNLYISCLLSLLNGVTLNKKVQTTIDNKKDSTREYEWYVIQNRLKNLDDSIILWQLDDSMVNMIKILLNRVKKMFMESIQNICKKYEVTPDMLDIMVSFNGGDYRGNTND